MRSWLAFPPRNGRPYDPQHEWLTARRARPPGRGRRAMTRPPSAVRGGSRANAPADRPNRAPRAASAWRSRQARAAFARSYGRDGEVGEAGPTGLRDERIRRRPERVYAWLCGEFRARTLRTARRRKRSVRPRTRQVGCSGLPALRAAACARVRRAADRRPDHQRDVRRRAALFRESARARRRRARRGGQLVFTTYQRARPTPQPPALCPHRGRLRRRCDRHLQGRGRVATPTTFIRPADCNGRWLFWSSTLNLEQFPGHSRR